MAIGIVWGGRKPTGNLAVQFGKTEPQPVEGFAHRTTRTWNLWRHTWRPAETGRYRIHCVFPDAGQPTRKVDGGSFDRRVVIDAV